IVAVRLRYERYARIDQLALAERRAPVIARERTKTRARTHGVDGRELLQRQIRQIRDELRTCCVALVPAGRQVVGIELCRRRIAAVRSEGRELDAQRR